MTTFIIILCCIILIGGIIFTIKYKSLSKTQDKNTNIIHEIQTEKEQLDIITSDTHHSMTYAERLVKNLLATDNYIHKLLPNVFILFKSKDIVSGDFYWIKETEDKIFIGAFDCTGHGIPGAFLSIIGLVTLRSITDNKPNQNAGEILNKLNDMFQKLYKYTTEPVHDGMDAALIALYKKENKIDFAGAINKLFLIRNNELQIIPGNRFSISPEANYGLFTNYTLDIKKNDMLYIFSDGFTDQVGGPDDKKLKYRRFNHLLLTNYKKSIKEQKDKFLRFINNWKGTNEQTDDILLIGIKIK